MSDTAPAEGQAEPVLDPEAPGIHTNAAGQLEIRWPRPDVITIGADLLEKIVAELNTHRRIAAMRAAADATATSTPPSAPASG